jgi:hypothetical protein
MGKLEKAAVSLSHPSCYPRFPDLEEGVGQVGDMCRMKSKERTNWACPVGCSPIEQDKQDSNGAPYCVQDGEQPCRQTECHEDWKPLFQELVKGTDDGDNGNRCTEKKLGDPEGFLDFLPPKSCKVKVEGENFPAPFTLNKKGGGICRTSGPSGSSAHHHPVAHWKLIATSTHEINVGLEVGVSDETGTTKGKEESSSQADSMVLGASGSWDNGVSDDEKALGAVGVGAKVEIKTTNAETIEEAVSESVESVKEMESTVEIEVNCPDGTDWLTDVNASNPLSQNMEYLYQWVVDNDKFSVKTEHFRCHQTNGDEIKPECPPKLCGEPKLNPYCKRSFNNCMGNRDPKTAEEI